MKSGQINRNSPVVDLLEICSGTWNEYDSDGWHVVKTPFFLSLSGVFDAGSHVVPFSFSVPVAGTLCCADGSVEAVIVRPGDSAVSIGKPGLVTMSLFGQLSAIRAR